MEDVGLKILFSARIQLTIKISCSTIETKEEPAFFIDQESLLTLDNCSIESSAKEVILGFGTLRLGNVSFPSQSKISSSVQVQKSADFFKVANKVGKKGDADPLHQPLQVI